MTTPPSSLGLTPKTQLLRSYACTQSTSIATRLGCPPFHRRRSRHCRLRTGGNLPRTGSCTDQRSGKQSFDTLDHWGRHQRRARNSLRLDGVWSPATMGGLAPTCRLPVDIFRWALGVPLCCVQHRIPLQVGVPVRVGRRTADPGAVLSALDAGSNDDPDRARRSGRPLRLGTSGPTRRRDAP